MYDAPDPPDQHAGRSKHKIGSGDEIMEQRADGNESIGPKLRIVCMKSSTL